MEEFNSLVENGTFQPVRLPPGRKAMDADGCLSSSARQMAQWTGTRLDWLPKAIPSVLELSSLRCVYLL